MGGGDNLVSGAAVVEGSGGASIQNLVKSVLANATTTGRFGNAGLTFAPTDSDQVRNPSAIVQHMTMCTPSFSAFAACVSVLNAECRTVDLALGWDLYYNSLYRVLCMCIPSVHSEIGKGPH